MKNITVTVDDETYRRARVRAAEQDTSVSAMVRAFLFDAASGETEKERMKREEKRLREGVVEFEAADRLSRDELYSRRS